MVIINKAYILLIWVISLGLQIQSQVILPARTYADSSHAPFLHGVASGDPLPTAVIIWTRITPIPLDYSTLSVNFQVSTDSMFSSITASGYVTTDSSIDWTIKKDILGLSPNTVYYYRFDDGFGNYSCIGRTKTAPIGSVTDLKFAVFSCSSVFSGFFNAYARIAEKADSLNAAIHLGDYIYDFVDIDEQVRVPTPYPIVPVTLEEWRDRHEYYLLDPDLRAAKSLLPWIILWDNHDQDCGGGYPCSFQGGNQAFLEWLPIRIPDTTNHLNLYRSFSFGNLADIILTDALMHRHNDTLPNGTYNILGSNQFNWMQNTLVSSSAKWKLFAQQRMLGGWYTTGIPQWLLDILPNDGPVFDNGSWDGFPDSRAMLFDILRTNLINNTIVLSGDAHVSIAQDLIEDPHDTSEYNPNTGAGSVGVEFLPTSITRGNMDEAGASIGAFDLVNNMDRNANPQHQFTDFFNHGYGILHLTSDSSIAQFWYTPKLTVSTQDSLGATLIVRDGENHWSRNSGYSSLENAPDPTFLLFPNPAIDFTTLRLSNFNSDQIRIDVTNLIGQTYIQEMIPNPGNNNIYYINTQQLPPGIYLVRINYGYIHKLIKN